MTRASWKRAAVDALDGSASTLAVPDRPSPFTASFAPSEATRAASVLVHRRRGQAALCSEVPLCVTIVSVLACSPFATVLIWTARHRRRRTRAKLAGDRRVRRTGHEPGVARGRHGLPMPRRCCRTEGSFTFPSPYNTTGIRLTTADDCGGQDCVRPVGYSLLEQHQQPRRQRHDADLPRPRAPPRRRRTDAVQLRQAHRRDPQRRPAVRRRQPVFARAPARAGTSAPRSRTTLYMQQRRPRCCATTSSPAPLRPRLDVTTPDFGANRYIWQVHSSDDDRVHSATLRDGATYAMLGCVVYREDTQQSRTFRRSDRRLRRVPDRQERPLAGDQGERRTAATARTTASSICRPAPSGCCSTRTAPSATPTSGFGYMVGPDNWNAQPGAVRTWRFDLDLQRRGTGGVGRGTGHAGLPDCPTGARASATSRTATRGPACRPTSRSPAAATPAGRLVPRVERDRVLSAGRIARRPGRRAEPDQPRCRRRRAQDYTKLPKGNLDLTGEYFIWTTNAGSNRLDAFIVRVPTALLNPAPEWEPVRWVDLVKRGHGRHAPEDQRLRRLRGRRRRLRAADYVG